MQITNLTWLTSCSCGCSGGNTILCKVCFGGLFPRWAKVTKAEIRCSGRFFPRWAKTTRAAIDDPMTASSNTLGFTKRVQITNIELHWLCHSFGMRARAVVVVVTLSSAMSASVAFFHVGPRSPKQKYAAPVVSFHVGPKRPEQREMIR